MFAITSYTSMLPCLLIDLSYGCASAVTLRFLLGYSIRFQACYREKTARRLSSHYLSGALMESHTTHGSIRSINVLRVRISTVTVTVGVIIALGPGQFVEARHRLRMAARNDGEIRPRLS